MKLKNNYNLNLIKMNEKKYNQRPVNQKFICESLKQDIISLSNIKRKFNDIIKKNQLINPKFFLNPDKSYQNKGNITPRLELNINHIENNYKSMRNLEKKIYKRFYKFYQTNEDVYNIKIINEIISNENSHIVAEFKDFLIKDDYSEFIQKFYKKTEIIPLLKQIFEYYKLSSVVYPNYILLPENKYIYRNIQKKQKIIDDQQEQEEKYNDEEFKKKNLTDRNNSLNKSEKLFDSKIIDSILNQSNTSQIQKFVFGFSNENSLDLGENNLINLVKNIKTAEENSYSKFLEKNKLLDKNIEIDFNNKEKNKKNINDKQNILNTCYVKNVNKIKQFINNNNSTNNNKLSSRNNKNYIDLPEFGKTYSHFSSNLINLKNIINKAGNKYCLFINKDKENKLKVNKNKTPINNKNFKIIKDKNLILEKENIKENEILVNKIKKDKNHGRNNKKNLFDLISKNQVNSLNKILKSDWNININNSNNLKSDNFNIKKPILISKEKKNKKENNTKQNLLFIQNLEFSKKQAKEKNKLIKKSVIKELLSLCSSNKETWRTSQLTESQRELGHSVNKSERKKKSIKNINQNIMKNNKNISDIITDIHGKNKNNILRNQNYIKNNKEISLDIEHNNNENKIYFKNSYNKISIPINNNFKKENTFTENNLNINSYNERNTIVVNKERDNYKYITEKLININSKNENKYNPINSKDKLIINKNRQMNLNNPLQNNKYANEKSSRNRSNVYHKYSNYAILNMKKLLDINNSIYMNTINSNDKNHSNFTIPHKTISSNIITSKDNLKLNLDYLKQGNLSKNVETNRESLSGNKNSKDIKNIINNNNMIKIKRLKELYPLSAREYNANNAFSIKNYNRVLKKSNKNKTLKNSFNETGINNIIFGYSNSFKKKNKFIKKTQNSKVNNQNLLIANYINKNQDEKNLIKKQKNNTITETNSHQKNKKNIKDHINQTTNNNSNLNSKLIMNFNSSLNNFSISKIKSRNTNDNNSLKEIKTINNKNDEKKNNYGAYSIHSPNIYNSNKKSNKREKCLISNKSINEKNTRYYNIEVNIHNDINNKTLNNKEKISIHKINPNISKQHIKLKSTQFSAGSLNINFNNYTNNYCINYNNSVIANHNKTKYTQIKSKNYKYKRIKNMKSNLKGFPINNIDKLILNKNKNEHFFPFAFTDRNKKVNLFSPINSYSINIPNKK